MLIAIIVLFALGTPVFGQDIVDGEYILRLKNDFPRNAEESFKIQLESNFNIHVQQAFHFRQATMFHVKGSTEDMSRVELLSEVKNVAPNVYMYPQQDCDPTSSGGTWGLDRIDQVEEVPYSNPTDPGATYIYGPDQGTGVRAYILDTGIDLFHSNFGGRVEWGHIADDIQNRNPGDFHGHGTHVAGIVGSASYGVAKDVTLVAVRTAEDSGTGTVAELLDGLQFVFTDLDRGTKSIVVITYVGVGQNPDVKDAINVLVDDGVSVVVAAGNYDNDACDYTPAYVPTAITVGYSDINDWSSGASNHGTCVDLFAPGVSILSTRPNESTGVASGSSYAAAHVAGCAARYISSRDPAPIPSQVFSYITTQATRDRLTFYSDQVAGTQNLLLFCHCLFELP